MGGAGRPVTSETHDQLCGVRAHRIGLIERSTVRPTTWADWCRRGDGKASHETLV